MEILFLKFYYYWNQRTQNCCASIYVRVMHSHRQQYYQRLTSSWSLKTTQYIKTKAEILNLLLDVSIRDSGTY